jgi:exodeoxyribonuclease III
MKIISWNVNGLNAQLKKNYLNELIINEDPDILCLGETKINSNFNDEYFVDKFKYRYWHISTIKKGYSGVSILIKNKKPLNIKYGLYDIDNEGRVITIEFSKFYLINVYTPNSGEQLKRLNFRTEIWDREFEKYIIELQNNDNKKSIIICGDLNVAHKEIDIKNPKTNLRSAGFTIEERNSFDIFLKNTELIDIYRYIYPNKIEYTYWTYLRKARDKNIGWRIDYFLINKKLIKKIKNINILTHILGSDHAPIKLIL